MGFCFQLQRGCCGAAIRTTVNCGFCHYLLHGVFVTSFVFSNTSYPVFYFIDYIFGISGATLIVVSIVGMILASVSKCQFLRALWALLVVLNVLTVAASCYSYTIFRWDDVITTALTRGLRRNMENDFPDTLWYSLAVIACIVSPFLLIYLVYIVSYMCNKWKAYLFTEHFDYDYFYHPTTTITVQTTPQSNAYPTHKK